MIVYGTTPSPTPKPDNKPEIIYGTTPSPTPKPDNKPEIIYGTTPSPTPKPDNKPEIIYGTTPSPTPRPDNKPEIIYGTTPSPTPKISRTPTPKPTKTPTVRPTKTPTPKPTKTPTVKPTKTPTPKPTKTPTPKRTKTPTPKPTKTPTVRPTKTPTPKPRFYSRDDTGKAYRRTFMIYMVGSNLETNPENPFYSPFCGYYDINEICQAGVDLSCTNVIVCMGGSYMWRSFRDLDTGETCIYELTEMNGAYAFRQMTRPVFRSMGESDVLTEFLRYSYTNYPADAYSLVFWDHGGGPLGGFGVDITHQNDGLELRELVHALEESPFSMSNRLELIGFDSCLMGNIEVAAALSPYAKYMIGSEEVDHWVSYVGLPWDFRFLGESTVRERDSEKLIRRICELHQESLSGVCDSIICGYRLQYVQGTCKVLDEIFGLRLRDAEDWYRMYPQMKKVKAITNWGTEPDRYDLYDLTAFAQMMRSETPSQAKRLLDVLDKLIIGKYTNGSGSKLNGISFFFPVHTGYLLEAINQFSVFSKNNVYENYRKCFNRIRSYCNIALSDSGPTGGIAQEDLIRVVKADDPSWRVPSNSVLNEPEDVRVFEVEINPALQSILRDSYYMILIGEGNDRYRLLEKGSGLTQNGNILTAALPMTALSVSGGAGTRWQQPAVTETVREDGSIMYVMPFVRDKDGYSQQLSAALAMTADNPAGTVTGVYPVDDGPMPNPMFDTLNKGDSLRLIQPLRELNSDDPALPGIFDDWMDIPEGALSDMPITVGKDGLLFSRQPLDPEKDYYVQLYVVDMYDAVYATPLMPFNR